MEREQVKAALDAITEEQITLDERMEVLRARFDLLAQLLATFGEEVPAPAEPKPKRDDARRQRDAERKRRSRKSEPRVEGGVTCPDCGQRFHQETGLKIHRGQKHKGSAAKPVELPMAEPVPGRESWPRPRKRLADVDQEESRAPLASVPDREEPAPAKVHRCGDCGHTVALGQLDALAKHTDREHRRRLLHTERMAVLPGEAA